MIKNSKLTTKVRTKMKTVIAAMSLFTVLSCSYMPVDNEIPDTIEIEEGRDYILYKPMSGTISTTGLMFYPGGLVEPHAYDVVLSQLAGQGYKVILAKMPLNLAVLKPFACFDIMERYPEMEQWVIAGHSLGGAMASKAVNKEPDAFKGLVLLAAYPDEDSELSSWNGSVMSISGSEDLLTTPQEIEDAKTFLPEGIVIEDASEIPTTGLNGKTIYYEIQGANHAQFANYGPQDDDGVATISGEEQLMKTGEVISSFWDLNQW